MNSFIDLLSDQIINKKCIFFLGSGISMSSNFELGIPTGKMLSEELQKMIYDNPNKRNGTKETLPELCQIYEWNYGRNALNNYFRKKFDKKEPLKAHLKLAQIANLSPVTMITTNYDELIEEAFRKFHFNLPIIVKNDSDLSEIDTTKSMLIKVHGSLSNLSDCIITEQDYYTWINSNGVLKDYLKVLMSLYNIVFVGYSLSDINFKLLIDDIRMNLGKYSKAIYFVSVDKSDTLQFQYQFIHKQFDVKSLQMKAEDFFDQLYQKMIELKEPLSYNSYFGDLYKNNTLEEYMENASSKIYQDLINRKCKKMLIDEEIRRTVYQKFCSQKFNYKKFISKNQSVESRMAFIPAGPFIYGGVESHDEPAIQIENIDHNYFIDIYPVSNKEYKEFLSVVQHMQKAGNSTYQHPDAPKNKDYTPRMDPNFKDVPMDYFTNPLYEDYPVVGIDWYDAYMYARFRGKRLPTTKEWEKAARGIDGRIYPYGDIFDPTISNTQESRNARILKIAANPKNISPWGCYDMSGNIWQWCADDLQGNLNGKYKCSKGGPFTRLNYKAKASFSSIKHVQEKWVSRGLRCVKDI